MLYRSAFFRNPRIKDSVHELLNNRDGLMLGICNGFQALLKLGLVPYGNIVDMEDNSPTLTFNTIGRHPKQYSPIHHVRPFLRPMSDIVKEIEVNGKKFIPLLALLKIISTTEHEHKIVDIAFKTYNMCGIISHAFVDYANETSNLGTLIYRFSYDLEFRRFGHFDKTRNIPLGVPFQVDLFDKLNEWHFDYRGLIEQGLAIDINTLKL